MNIRRHCWKIDLLVNLCGGLQENSWFMVETSLVSSGNCVAYPLCYSSSCCITQFLIAQKGSLNSYFLQFSLKLVTFLDSWTSNGKLFQRETTLTEKKFHLISVLNLVAIRFLLQEVFLVSLVCWLSTVQNQMDGFTLSKQLRILKVCTKSQRLRRISSGVRPSSINLSLYHLLFSPTIKFTALF